MIKKTAMIAALLKMNPDAKPVSNKRSLMDCFTERDGEIYLWWNNKSGSTHVLRESEVIVNIKGR